MWFGFSSVRLRVELVKYLFQAGARNENIYHVISVIQLLQQLERVTTRGDEEPILIPLQEPLRGCLWPIRRWCAEYDFDQALPPRCQLVDRSFRDDPAGTDDGDTLTDALNFAQVMRRHENGCALSVELFKDVLERTLHKGIKPIGRLVKDEQF